MVDIMTSPAHDLPLEAKDVDVEDGELPEEGEIEDDEEEVKPPPPRHHRQSRFDPVDQTRHTAPEVNTSNAQEAWEKSVKEKDKTVVAGAAAVIAPAVELAFPPVDQDYRQTEGSADKDYRWGAEAPIPTHSHDNHVGDSDYRDTERHERRRRRSPTPEDRVKRSRYSPPIRRGLPPRRDRRWTERQICKFFREGYCRDGDHCAYSHQAADSMRKPELCKFYQSGYCKKGLQCNLLHGEFPCKAFHKGECSRDPCQFSHQPLTEYTRPLFEQMMKDEELSARIQLPAVPPRRRVRLHSLVPLSQVLIPGGPMQPPAAAPVAVAGPPVDPALNGGVLPPPSVVVPQLSTTTLPMPPSLPMPPVVASAVAVPTTLPSLPYPPTQQFYPPTSLPTAVPIEQSLNQPHNPSVAPQSQSFDPNSSFNINRMLAQLAGTSEPVYEESPASPPATSEQSVLDPRMFIPQTATITWRLVPVDVPSPPYFDSTNQLMNSTTKNDPRLQRLISSQFDAVSSIIGKSVSVDATSPAAPLARPADPRAPPAVRDPRRRPEERRTSEDKAPSRPVSSWMPHIGSN